MRRMIGSDESFSPSNASLSLHCNHFTAHHRLGHIIRDMPKPSRYRSSRKLGNIDPNTFASILSLLDTEDVFNLWMTGDRTLQEGAFGHGMAVTTLGLSVTVAKHKVKWRFPSLLASSWTNLRHLSLQLRQMDRKNSNKTQIAGLGLQLLPKRLTRLQLVSQTIFAELDHYMHKEGMSLGEQCPDLDYLSLEGESNPSLELLSSLPKNLASLRLFYTKELDPNLISRLPRRITRLDVVKQGGLESDAPELIQSIEFPPQLSKLNLASSWSSAALPLLPETLEDLEIRIPTRCSSSSIYSSLPRGLKVLDIETFSIKFDADAVKSIPCKYLQHLTVRSAVDLDDKPETLKSVPTNLETFRIFNRDGVLFDWTPQMVACLPSSLQCLDCPNLRLSAPEMLPLLTELRVWNISRPISNPPRLPPLLQRLTVAEACIDSYLMSTLPRKGLTFLRLAVAYEDMIRDPAWLRQIPVASLRHFQMTGPMEEKLLQTLGTCKHLETLIVNSTHIQAIQAHEFFENLPKTLTQIDVILAGTLLLSHLESLSPSVRKLRIRSAYELTCNFKKEDALELAQRKSLTQLVLDGLTYRQSKTKAAMTAILGTSYRRPLHYLRENAPYERHPTFWGTENPQ